MKRAGDLYDQTCDMGNLRLAFCKARRGKRDRPDVLAFSADLETNLRRLRNDLLSGDISCGPYQAFTIYEPKERIIRVAPFRDRVLHHAVMNVCEPVFDAYQVHGSYACRKGRGTYAALDAARHFCGCNEWFLKLDVRKYFDSIPHDRLLRLLERRFKDRQLLRLFVSIIESHQAEEGIGLPIGNLTSQFFANHYLAPADHFVKERLRRRAYVRYMDDMVLWAESPERLVVLGSRLTWFLQQELGLTVKPWCMNRTAQGLPFLGHIVRDRDVTLSVHSKSRYQAKLTEAFAALESGSWDQAEFAAHVQALVAVTEYADERDFRRNALKNMGIIHRVRTA